MRKRLIIILLIFLLMLLPSSCTTRKYLNHRGYPKRIPIYLQDKYRHPLTKKETKQKLIKPTTINLNKW